MRILILPLLASFTFLLAQVPGRMISPRGLGKVQIGMTVDQASLALGAKLRASHGIPPNDECYYVYSDELFEGVDFMVRKNKISSIAIGGVAKGITTDNGISVGDSEEKVIQVYGNKIEIQPHSDGGEGDHYLTFWVSSKKELGIRFDCFGGRVFSIKAGDKSILLIEGCS